MAFLHGVEVVELEGGPRPITNVASSVIGLVGTAAQGPVNEPVLISGSRKDAIEIFGSADGSSTIPDALDAIFDQGGAMVVVININDPDSDESPDVEQGLRNLLAAESRVHMTPRILIAPGFCQQPGVVDAMIEVADRLRAVAVVDGPDGSDEDAITFRGNIDSARVYLVDPHVLVFDKASGTELVQPASARVAGVIARSDNDRGFWWSPSNRTISGITGTSRGIDFSLGDSLATANRLNEKQVATIIHQNGYRLWGNRSCSSDPKFAFISVRRTADLINDSLLRAHLDAVDQNITKTYIENVTESVNSYLRYLKSIGAIIDGKCFADPDLNTPENIAQGKVYIDFDFTPPYPAEHITFRSSLVNDYLEEIFA
ncbi:phage tail sheath subtilisin-like domain-containing protein [Gynuella sp.]|uniref:phage tail sheath subtilisin-like domain-containing protein n=1 Tax=Gynuella sp. TaxID=2969146 RepID=UPI003D0AE32C